MAEGIEVKNDYAGKGYVETFTGTFDFHNPHFEIADIAHSLGQLCRWNGHIRGFYSVAEHSVMVARIMERMQWGNPFEGLMHDATEAYMSDCPAPFKQFFPDWRANDERLDRAMREQFGLPLVKSKGCSDADWICAFIEAKALLRTRGENFTDPYKMRPVALRMEHWPECQIYCFEPEHASALFQRYYERYRPR